jgi:hypothetical protein
VTASTPWVPLVAAVVAALTALGTTTITQALTRRRDDVRWQRERAERREQWRREDEARWLADRRSAYTQLLTALHEYESLTAALRGVRPDDADRRQLRDVASAAERARQAVLLIAAAPVAAATDAALAAIRRGDADPGSAPGGFTPLHRAMRADLGVAVEAGPVG